MRDYNALQYNVFNINFVKYDFFCPRVINKVKMGKANLTSLYAKCWLILRPTESIKITKSYGGATEYRETTCLMFYSSTFETRDTTCHLFNIIG